VLRTQGLAQVRAVADVEETDGPSSKSNKRKVRPIKTSRLRGWYTGTYAEIANTKRGHMDKNGFEDILMEFTLMFEELKQLARELRVGQDFRR
jgi:hypothetical protein